MTIDRLATALADRYTIVRELGQGGMATVYLAEDLKHHRKVALKVLGGTTSSWPAGTAMRSRSTCW